jgi:hypothetical protein
MARHAVSDAVKAQKKRRVVNESYQRAIERHEAEQQKPEFGPDGKKQRLSGQAIARIYKVNAGTLLRLAKGTVSMSAFNASKQKVTPPEERVMVDYAKECANQALPCTHADLTKIAEGMVRSRIPDAVMGKKWSSGFLTRHHDELAGHWSRPLELIRASSLNPETVRHWFFDIVKKNIINDELVAPRHMWGVDEAGIAQSGQSTERVIGKRGSKGQHKSGGGGKKQTTVLVFICADGTTSRPTVIFEGKNFMRKWNNRNEIHAQ